MKKLSNDSTTGRQCIAILAHLFLHGSITSIEAVKLYEITRLAARIWDLRNIYGQKIKAEKVNVQTRWGETMVVRYALKEEEE